MGIEDTQLIDMVSTDPNADEVVLTATDHLEWGSRNHFMASQEKLNSYLAFIESGEVIKSAGVEFGYRVHEI